MKNTKGTNRIQDYFVKVLNGMALGLFATLLIGLIIKQIGSLLNLEILIQYGNISQKLMGPGIGAAVAYSVGAPPLAIFACVVVGALGAGSISFEGTNAILNIGEPVGAFVASLLAAEFSKIISGKTKVDIVLVPLSTIIIGGASGNYISPFISQLVSYIGSFINMATELHPIPMGIILSVVMGILLTLPLSSAALAISLKLSGLAAGAATVGCCANMIGFAIISFGENGFGGLLAQGLGTSMLQISNIIKNPKIWIPSIVASAILGPISSSILKMESSMIGAGMGTSGLVGQFALVETMGASIEVFVMILGMHFILPAIISFSVYKWMKDRGYIKNGDMKL